MIADLSSLKFITSFFAELVCTDTPLQQLKDGVLYILTQRLTDGEKSKAELQKSIGQIEIKSFKHLPFGIELLDDMSLFQKDSFFSRKLEGDANFIMPLYTPDRSYKYYFVGFHKDLSTSAKTVLGMLSDDAKKIYIECSFAAFVNIMESDPHSAKNLWVQLLSNDDSKDRDKYKEAVSEYTFLGKGFETSKFSKKIPYSELREKLKKFPEIIKKLSQVSDLTAVQDEKYNYMDICHNLSPVEKNELILELSKRIDNQSVLEDIINGMIEKTDSGKLTITIKNYRDVKRKKDGRRINSDWITCLVNPSTKVQKILDFGPTPHVVYIMNLLHRIENPNDMTPLNIRDHKEKFLDIYSVVYGYERAEDYEGIKEAKDLKYSKDPKYKFDKLVKNTQKTDGSGYQSSQLSDCYKHIVNCVNLHCSFFNQSPYPYLIDKDKPLTVDSKLIDISDFKKKLTEFTQKKSAEKIVK